MLFRSELPLLQSALPSNESHLKRAIGVLSNLKTKRLGVFGLAFKENTDDLRESPVVSLLEHLIGKGREVRVFDPHIRLNAIYGANREFILHAIPHIGRLLQDNLQDMLGWAESVAITQKPDVETARRIREKGLPVLDLSGTQMFGAG